MEDRIYFDTIKKKSDRFFIEYHPPIPGGLFAGLSVNYIDDIDLDGAANELLIQSHKWINKYPVAIMASAFDRTGSFIDFSPLKGGGHLTLILTNGVTQECWGLVADSEFVDGPLSRDNLLNIYSDLNYRTQEEINNKLDTEAKSRNRFNLIIAVWAVVIPALITILEFFSPTWVAVLALGYSLWKAYKEWSLLTGKSQKSEKEKAKEKEELRIRHHHYHCDINPGGFQRLKLENLTKSIEDGIQTKYNEIK